MTGFLFSSKGVTDGINTVQDIIKRQNDEDWRAGATQRALDLAQGQSDIAAKAAAKLRGEQKQEAVDFNQSLASVLPGVRAEAADQFVVNPENHAKLFENKEFQQLGLGAPLSTEDQKLFAEAQAGNPELTQEVFANRLAQGRHITDQIAGFRSPENIAKYTNPDKFKASLRQKYAGTSATPEQIDAAIERDMASEYDTMDPEIFKTVYNQTGSGGIPSGMSKLFKEYTGGSSGGGSGKVSDKNLMDQVRFVEEMKGSMGIESGDGGWTRTAFGWLTDWGNPDLNEIDFETFQGYTSALGASESESIIALKSIMNEDTTPRKINEIINADPKGNSEASKLHAKVLNRISSMKRNENRGGGLGSTAMGRQIATMMASNSNRQDKLLSGLQPQAATQEQRLQQWLRGFAPNAAPQSDKGSGGTQSGKGKGTTTKTGAKTPPVAATPAPVDAPLLSNTPAAPRPDAFPNSPILSGVEKVGYGINQQLGNATQALLQPILNATIGSTDLKPTVERQNAELRAQMNTEDRQLFDKAQDSSTSTAERYRILKMLERRYDTSVFDKNRQFRNDYKLGDLNKLLGR